MMFRKIIICFTLICFTFGIQGCTSKYAIPTEQLEQQLEYKNMTIETIDNEVYEFDIVQVYDDYIEGYVDDSTLVRIPTEEVQSAYTRGFDLTKTAWFTLGVMSFVFATWMLIFALTFEI